MIKIMGGNKDSEPFKFYCDLTINAFLAIRKYHQHIANLTFLMLD